MDWRDAETNKDVIEQAKMKLLSLYSGFQNQIGTGHDEFFFIYIKKVSNRQQIYDIPQYLFRFWVVL